MSTNNYFKELEKNLKMLDSKSREEIIREIKGIAGDDDYNTLVKRFGKPDKFASNYIDESPKEKKSRALKYAGYGSLGLLSIFALGFFAVKSYIADPFDFSKYDANTIDSKIDKKWTKIEGIKTLDINQAKVVIYMSDDKNTSYTCDEETTSIKESVLSLKHAFCYIKVPKDKLTLNVFQANVVLVKPVNTVIIDSEQSSIELASNGQNYDFKFDIDSSSFKDFVSKSASVEIKGKLYQSNFEKYEY